MKVPFKIIAEIAVEPGDDKTQLKMSCLYICDRMQCENCIPECYLTSNVRHAKKYDIFTRVLPPDTDG